MVCHNCGTLLVEWQTTCPACGVPTREPGITSRAARFLRQALRPALLAAGLAILLAVAYIVASRYLTLWFWTVPLMLEVRDRVRDHPAAIAMLGDEIRVGWLAATVVRDETGWREYRMSAPVSGPKTEATLTVRAGRTTRGPWAYTTLTLENGKGERLDLLEAPRADIAPPPRPRRVYLVPLGEVHSISLAELARYYRTRLALQVDVLPVIDVPTSLRDHARRQLVAESAVETIRWRVGNPVMDPSAVFIAITDEDMYISNAQWPFAFSYRGDDRFAVVSTARMAPMTYAYRGKEYLLYTRTRKVVGKNIGLLVYRFPLSEDPRSLLSDRVVSVADLDAVRDIFADVAPRPRAPQTPVTYGLPPVEPRIPARAIPQQPGPGYPCFVMRPGVPPSSAGTATTAAITTCNVGMRSERDYDELEVDLRSGMLMVRKTDLLVPDVLPLALTRCYRLWDRHPRAFGIGGNHPYETFPVGSRRPFTYIDVITADGARIHYDRISEGSGYVDAVYEHVETASPFFRSRVKWNGKGWDLTLPDGSILVFPESYSATRSAEAALVGIRDASNRAVTFDRDGRRNLRKLTAPSGRFISFEYDVADRITVALDDRGRRVRYQYDPGGRLATVTDHTGRTVRYHYEGADLLGMDGGDPASAVQVRYSRARVSEVRLPDDRRYRFRFDVTEPGSNHATTAFVTDPAGTTTEIDVRSGAVRGVVSAR